MQLLFEGGVYSKKYNICMEDSYLHSGSLYGSQCPHKILSAPGQAHDSGVRDHSINKQATWGSQLLYQVASGFKTSEYSVF